MDAPATYTLAPPCTAACAGCAKPRGPEAPPLLSAFQLAGLADALTAEREDCASEPANALGYWPAAVAGLLAHVAEAERELSAYQQNQAGHELDIAAMRAEGTRLLARLKSADGDVSYLTGLQRQTEDQRDVLSIRVKEQQAELADRVEQLTGSNKWVEELTADFAALLTNANAWQQRAEQAEARNLELRNEAVALQRELSEMTSYKQHQEWLAQMRAGYPVTLATAAADKLEGRIREQQAELADQEASRMILILALKAAEKGLADCYDVVTYTANGSSLAEKGLMQVQRVLAGVNN